MNQWFRSWHGAPTDPKWIVVAKKAGVVPGIVSAVVWALFDHGSQADDRGDVSDFDVETYATVMGFDEDDIAAVIRELENKAVIIDGRLSAWDRRQPRREDDSSERVRKHRGKNRTPSHDSSADVTHCNASNASVTQCNADAENVTLDKIREDKNRIERKNAASGASDEIELFRRGKEVLGTSAGGMIRRLLTAKGENIPLARAAVEMASTKQNPREYIGAILNKRDGPDDLRARGEAW